MRVLIIEDDYDIASIIADYLILELYEVKLCLTGSDAMRAFNDFQPDLIILDLMLPDIDGFEICRMIREVSTVPILILSAKTDELDKLLGLQIGADDYVTKPFKPKELVARVKALWRRANLFNQETPSKDTINNLEINPLDYTVVHAGQRVDLSSKEFELLNYLASNPNQVFTREQLYHQVWGQGQVGEINTVTVYINRLRNKLEENPKQPTMLRTVWGVGYKFEKRISSL